VKFTSVIFDFNILFIYLNNQQEKKTKQPDIGPASKIQSTEVIRSPMPVLQAEHFIFLNFVFKIQLQYNTRELTPEGVE